MVSVAHREQKCRAVFCAGIVKFLERGLNAIEVVVGFNRPAFYRAAVLHQLSLVKGRSAARLYFVADSFNQGAVGVVGQKHYVGKLQGRAPPDFHSGRNAFQNRGFGGAGKRCGKGLPFVAVQVKRGNQAFSDSAVGCGSLNVNHFFLRSGEDSFVNVGGHRLLYFLYALGLSAVI